MTVTAVTAVVPPAHRNAAFTGGVRQPPISVGPVDNDETAEHDDTDQSTKPQSAADSNSGPSLDNLLEQSQTFLGAGLELEGGIALTSRVIREQSKIAYGSDLLDARLSLMAVLAGLVDLHPEEVLPTGPDRSEAMGLIAAFIQGSTVSETLISEGQYVKAAAVLKQDIEMVARLGEIRAGVTPAKKNHVPNVKYATGSGRLYHQLNDVAHISKPELINILLDRRQLDDEHAAIGPRPTFIADTAVELYALHVWTIVQVGQEMFRLADAIAAGPDDRLAQVALYWKGAVARLERAGHIEESPSN